MENDTFSVQQHSSSSLSYNLLSKVELPQPLPPTDGWIAFGQLHRPTANIIHNSHLPQPPAMARTCLYYYEMFKIQIQSWKMMKQLYKSDCNISTYF